MSILNGVNFKVSRGDRYVSKRWNHSEPRTGEIMEMFIFSFWMGKSNSQDNIEKEKWDASNGVFCIYNKKIEKLMLTTNYFVVAL